MRIAITLALLAALGSPAHADGDVGVIVTGEGSMQPQLTAQIESWLRQHGHKLVPSPLPPDAITALIDCFVMQDAGCARGVVEQRAVSTSMVFARLDTKDNASNGTRDVTLTAYWFDKGHEAISQSKTCQRCTDQSLRTTADEIMKKLVGGGDVGHLKIKSIPAGAKIIIDGQAIGVTPLDWDLPSGKHTIQMAKDGLKPDSRDVLVVSNKTDLLAMKLAPADEETHGEEQPSRLLPITMLAVGGAALIAGGVLWAIDEGPSNTYNLTYRESKPAGVGLVIGGAVVGGVGAAWLLFHSPKTTSSPVAAVTSDSAYIGWFGRF